MAALPGNRVLVTGLPAAGKTTVAKTLAARDHVLHIEVDRLYFGPGYSVRPSYVQEVEELIAQEKWVLDDVGYAETRDLIWERADAVVWLDLPWRLVVGRAVRRTWRRLRTGYEMLPGLKESWTGWGHPKHPVSIAVRKHRSERRAMQRRLADPRWAGLTVVRLTSQAQVDAFLGATTLLLSS